MVILFTILHMLKNIDLQDKHFILTAPVSLFYYERGFLDCGETAEVERNT